MILIDGPLDEGGYLIKGIGSMLISVLLQKLSDLLLDGVGKADPGEVGGAVEELSDRPELYNSDVEHELISIPPCGVASELLSLALMKESSFSQYCPRILLTESSEASVCLSVVAIL
jgi:hypothetical protein